MSSTPGIRRRLRLGVMCEGFQMARWQADCIQQILDQGLAELSLAIIDHPGNREDRNLWQKLKRVGLSHLLFVLYRRTLFWPRSLRSINLTDTFAAIPRIRCRVRREGKHSQYFSSEDIAAIRAQRLDLVLRFGFNIIRGEIHNAATYGIWSFHHGDELKYRGGPPCFWEIYKGDCETGAILQRLTDRLDAGVVLRKGIFRTKDYSFARNLDQVYRYSAKWPAEVCRDIVNGCGDYLSGSPSPTTAPIYRVPTNRQFLRAACRVFWSLLKRLWLRHFTIQRWNVAAVRMPIQQIISADPGQIAEACATVLRLPNPRSFNADCFGLRVESGTALLLEELDYSQAGVGRISGRLLDDTLKEERCFQPQGLPGTGHHSYPFLYRESRETYLIPESGGQRCVSLYRAVSFPEHWMKVTDLLTGRPFVDPTLVRHDGLYWLFYGIADDEFDCDLHLHVAYSDRLEGPFTPHAANPVKTSARSSRPAGTPFLDQQGSLIRPAQNFCCTYGGSIVFNRVHVLTPTAYDEEEVGELKPWHPDYPDGTHTIAAVDAQTTLIDMKRHVFAWPSRQPR